MDEQTNKQSMMGRQTDRQTDQQTVDTQNVYFRLVYYIVDPKITI